MMSKKRSRKDDTDKRARCVEAREVITACTCAHQLTRPDILAEDKECFEHLLKQVKGSIQIPAQDPTLPVLYPPLNMDRYSGDACVIVEFKGDPGLLRILTWFCNSPPDNAHMLIPRILFMVKEGNSCKLVFERVPVVDLAASAGISDDHKKAMVVGLATALEDLSAKGYYLPLTRNEIVLTSGCQVALLPTALVRITPIVEGTAFSISMHPDTVCRRNVHQPMVAWWLESMLNCDDPDDSFDFTAKDLIKELTVPNTLDRHRTVVSAARLLHRKLVAYSHYCEYSGYASVSSREPFPIDQVTSTLREMVNTNDKGIDLGYVDR